MDVRGQSQLAEMPILLAEINAALEWWREAGVDQAFEDTPREWLVPEAQAAEPVDPGSFPAITAAPAALPPPTRASIGGDRALWPAEPAAFTPWWLNEAALDDGQIRGRVPPRGPVAAPLMVLVPGPEAQDSAMLLSGPHGRLLAAMLAAMGLDETQVYFASALPRHMPMADWRDLAARGLGDVLRHHLALIRPQRIIAFGRPFAPLLAPPGLESPPAGHAPPQTMPIFPIISHDSWSASVLIARDLGSLLERPIAKGQFWQQWLEWSGG